jgi:hypothetical protein
MDLSDPEVWKSGVMIVLNAPHVVAPAIGLVAFGVWWFRGSVEKGARLGLKERVTALEERLRLAQDKEVAIREKLVKAEAQVSEVKLSLPDESLSEVAKRASVATETISEIMIVSQELHKLLLMPSSHENPKK